MTIPLPAQVNLIPAKGREKNFRCSIDQILSLWMNLYTHKGKHINNRQVTLSGHDQSILYTIRTKAAMDPHTPYTIVIIHILATKNIYELNRQTTACL